MIAERLEQRRRQVGISQAELARRVHMSQPAMNSILRGNTSSTGKLHWIARELRTTPAYLSGEVDDPELDAPPAPDLTHDESEMLDAWRQLTAQDQHALHRIMQSMIAPRTLHSPSLAFNTGGRK